nr:MATH and LRR domain-containing protein PFE0570w-like [Plodia interpunctella]
MKILRIFAFFYLTLTVCETLVNVDLQTVTKSAIESDNPFLLKLLQSVDEAPSNEYLFDVTLKLLKSLCICMRETLREKQKNLLFTGETNTLYFEDNSHEDDVKVLDLYKTIYNKTCFNLQKDLIKHNAPEHTTCGKGENLLQKKGNVANHTNFHKNELDLKAILFKSFILTKRFHNYTVKKHHLYKKVRAPVSSRPNNGIIFLITFYPDNTNNQSISFNTTEDLDYTIFSNSLIDITILTTKLGTERNRYRNEVNRNVSECNLQSLYMFLTENESKNLTRKFRIHKGRGPPKIYIETVVKDNIDYLNTCCDNRTRTPECDKNSLEESIKTDNKSAKTLEHYKDTISKIKNLVKLYKKRVEGKEKVNNKMFVMNSIIKDRNIERNYFKLDAKEIHKLRNNKSEQINEKNIIKTMDVLLHSTTEYLKTMKIDMLRIKNAMNNNKNNTNFNTDKDMFEKENYYTSSFKIKPLNNTRSIAEKSTDKNDVSFFATTDYNTVVPTRSIIINNTMSQTSTSDHKSAFKLSIPIPFITNEIGENSIMSEILKDSQEIKATINNITSAYTKKINEIDELSKSTQKVKFTSTTNLPSNKSATESLKNYDEKIVTPVKGSEQKQTTENSIISAITKNNKIDDIEEPIKSSLSILKLSSTTTLPSSKSQTLILNNYSENNILENIAIGSKKMKTPANDTLSANTRSNKFDDIEEPLKSSQSTKKLKLTFTATTPSSKLQTLILDHHSKKNVMPNIVKGTEKIQAKVHYIISAITENNKFHDVKEPSQPSQSTHQLKLTSTANIPSSKSQKLLLEHYTENNIMSNNVTDTEMMKAAINNITSTNTKNNKFNSIEEPSKSSQSTKNLKLASTAPSSKSNTIVLDHYGMENNTMPNILKTTEKTITTTNDIISANTKNNKFNDIDVPLKSLQSTQKLPSTTILPSSKSQTLILDYYNKNKIVTVTVKEKNDITSVYTKSNTFDNNEEILNSGNGKQKLKSSPTTTIPSSKLETMTFANYDKNNKMAVTVKHSPQEKARLNDITSAYTKSNIFYNIEEPSTSIKAKEKVKLTAATILSSSESNTFYHYGKKVKDSQQIKTTVNDITSPYIKSIIFNDNEEPLNSVNAKQKLKSTPTTTLPSSKSETSILGQYGENNIMQDIVKDSPQIKPTANDIKSAYNKSNIFHNNEEPLTPLKAKQTLKLTAHTNSPSSKSQSLLLDHHSENNILPVTMKDTPQIKVTVNDITSAYTKSNNKFYNNEETLNSVNGKQTLKLSSTTIFPSSKSQTLTLDHNGENNILPVTMKDTPQIKATVNDITSAYTKSNNKFYNNEETLNSVNGKQTLKLSSTTIFPSSKSQTLTLDHNGENNILPVTMKDTPQIKATVNDITSAYTKSNNKFYNNEETLNSVNGKQTLKLSSTTIFPSSKSQTLTLDHNGENNIFPVTMKDSPQLKATVNDITFPYTKSNTFNDNEKLLNSINTKQKNNFNPSTTIPSSQSEISILGQYGENNITAAVKDSPQIKPTVNDIKSEYTKSNTFYNIEESLTSLKAKQTLKLTPNTNSPSSKSQSLILDHHSENNIMPVTVNKDLSHIKAKVNDIASTYTMSNTFNDNKEQLTSLNAKQTLELTPISTLPSSKSETSILGHYGVNDIMPVTVKHLPQIKATVNDITYSYTKSNTVYDIKEPLKLYRQLSSTTTLPNSISQTLILDQYGENNIMPVTVKDSPQIKATINDVTSAYTKRDIFYDIKEPLKLLRQLSSTTTLPSKSQTSILDQYGEMAVTVKDSLQMIATMNDVTSANTKSNTLHDNEGQLTSSNLKQKLKLTAATTLPSIKSHTSITDYDGDNNVVSITAKDLPQVKDTINDIVFAHTKSNKFHDNKKPSTTSDAKYKLKLTSTTTLPSSKSQTFILDYNDNTIMPVTVKDSLPLQIKATVNDITSAYTNSIFDDINFITTSPSSKSKSSILDNYVDNNIIPVTIKDSLQIKATANDITTAYTKSNTFHDFEKPLTPLNVTKKRKPTSTTTLPSSKSQSLILDDMLKDSTQIKATANDITSAYTKSNKFYETKKSQSTQEIKLIPTTSLRSSKSQTLIMPDIVKESKQVKATINDITSAYTTSKKIKDNEEPLKSESVQKLKLISTNNLSSSKSQTLIMDSYGEKSNTIMTKTLKDPEQIKVAIDNTTYTKSDKYYDIEEPLKSSQSIQNLKKITSTTPLLNSKSQSLSLNHYDKNNVTPVIANGQSQLKDPVNEIAFAYTKSNKFNNIEVPSKSSQATQNLKLFNTTLPSSKFMYKKIENNNSESIENVTKKIKTTEKRETYKSKKITTDIIETNTSSTINSTSKNTDRENEITTNTFVRIVTPKVNLSRKGLVEKIKHNNEVNAVQNTLKIFNSNEKYSTIITMVDNEIKTKTNRGQLQKETISKDDAVTKPTSNNKSKISTKDKSMDKNKSETTFIDKPTEKLDINKEFSTVISINSINNMTNSIEPKTKNINTKVSRLKSIDNNESNIIEKTKQTLLLNDEISKTNILNKTATEAGNIKSLNNHTTKKNIRQLNTPKIHASSKNFNRKVRIRKQYMKNLIPNQKFAQTWKSKINKNNTKAATKALQYQANVTKPVINSKETYVANKTIENKLSTNYVPSNKTNVDYIINMLTTTSTPSISIIDIKPKEITEKYKKTENNIKYNKGTYMTFMKLPKYKSKMINTTIKTIPIYMQAKKESKSTKTYDNLKLKKSLTISGPTVQPLLFRFTISSDSLVYAKNDKNYEAEENTILEDTTKETTNPLKIHSSKHDNKLYIINSTTTKNILHTKNKPNLNSYKENTFRSIFTDITTEINNYSESTLETYSEQKNKVNIENVTHYNSVLLQQPEVTLLQTTTSNNQPLYYQQSISKELFENIPIKNMTPKNKNYLKKYHDTHALSLSSEISSGESEYQDTIPGRTKIINNNYMFHNFLESTNNIKTTTSENSNKFHYFIPESSSPASNNNFSLREQTEQNLKNKHPSMNSYSNQKTITINNITEHKERKTKNFNDLKKTSEMIPGKKNIFNNNLNVSIISNGTDNKHDSTLNKTDAISVTDKPNISKNENNNSMLLGVSKMLPTRYNRPRLRLTKTIMKQFNVIHEITSSVRPSNSFQTTTSDIKNNLYSINQTVIERKPLVKKLKVTDKIKKDTIKNNTEKINETTKKYRLYYKNYIPLTPQKITKDSILSSKEDNILEAIEIISNKKNNFNIVSKLPIVSQNSSLSKKEREWKNTTAKTSEVPQNAYSASKQSLQVTLPIIYNESPFITDRTKNIDVVKSTDKPNYMTEKLINTTNDVEYKTEYYVIKTQISTPVIINPINTTDKMTKSNFQIKHRTNRDPNITEVKNINVERNVLNKLAITPRNITNEKFATKYNGAINFINNINISESVKLTTLPYKEYKLPFLNNKIKNKTYVNKITTVPKFTFGDVAIPKPSHIDELGTTYYSPVATENIYKALPSNFQKTSNVIEPLTPGILIDKSEKPMSRFDFPDILTHYSSTEAISVTKDKNKQTTVFSDAFDKYVKKSKNEISQITLKPLITNSTVIYWNTTQTLNRGFADLLKPLNVAVVDSKFIDSYIKNNSHVNRTNYDNMLITTDHIMTDKTKETINKTSASKTESQSPIDKTFSHITKVYFTLIQSKELSESSTNKSTAQKSIVGADITHNPKQNYVVIKSQTIPSMDKHITNSDENDKEAQNFKTKTEFIPALLTNKTNEIISTSRISNMESQNISPNDKTRTYITEVPFALHLEQFGSHLSTNIPVQTYSSRTNEKKINIVDVSILPNFKVTENNQHANLESPPKSYQNTVNKYKLTNKKQIQNEDFHFKSEIEILPNRIDMTTSALNKNGKHSDGTNNIEMPGIDVNFSGRYKIFNEYPNTSPITTTTIQNSINRFNDIQFETTQHNAFVESITKSLMPAEQFDAYTKEIKIKSNNYTAATDNTEEIKLTLTNKMSVSKTESQDLSPTNEKFTYPTEVPFPITHLEELSDSSTNKETYTSNFRPDTYKLKKIFVANKSHNTPLTDYDQNFQTKQELISSEIKYKIEEIYTTPAKNKSMNISEYHHVSPTNGTLTYNNNLTHSGASSESSTNKDAKIYTKKATSKPTIISFDIQTRQQSILPKMADKTEELIYPKTNKISVNKTKSQKSFMDTLVQHSDRIDKDTRIFQTKDVYNLKKISEAVKSQNMHLTDKDIINSDVTDNGNTNFQTKQVSIFPNLTEKTEELIHIKTNFSKSKMNSQKISSIVPPIRHSKNIEHDDLKFQTKQEYIPGPRVPDETNEIISTHRMSASNSESQHLTPVGETFTYLTTIPFTLAQLGELRDLSTDKESYTYMNKGTKSTIYDFDISNMKNNTETVKSQNTHFMDKIVSDNDANYFLTKQKSIIPDITHKTKEIIHTNLNKMSGQVDSKTKSRHLYTTSEIFVYQTEVPFTLTQSGVLIDPRKNKESYAPIIDTHIKYKNYTDHDDPNFQTTQEFIRPQITDKNDETKHIPTKKISIINSESETIFPIDKRFTYLTQAPDKFTHLGEITDSTTNKKAITYMSKGKTNIFESDNISTTSQNISLMDKKIRNSNVIVNDTIHFQRKQKIISPEIKDETKEIIHVPTNKISVTKKELQHLYPIGRTGTSLTEVPFSITELGELSFKFNSSKSNEEYTYMSKDTTKSSIFDIDTYNMKESDVAFKSGIFSNIPSIDNTTKNGQNFHTQQEFILPLVTGEIISSLTTKMSANNSESQNTSPNEEKLTYFTEIPFKFTDSRVLGDSSINTESYAPITHIRHSDETDIGTPILQTTQGFIFPQVTDKTSVTKNTPTNKMILINLDVHHSSPIDETLTYPTEVPFTLPHSRELSGASTIKQDTDKSKSSKNFLPIVGISKLPNLKVTHNEQHAGTSILQKSVNTKYKSNNKIKSNIDYLEVISITEPSMLSNQIGMTTSKLNNIILDTTKSIEKPGVHESITERHHTFLITSPMTKTTLQNSENTFNYKQTTTQYTDFIENLTNSFMTDGQFDQHTKEIKTKSNFNKVSKENNFLGKTSNKIGHKNKLLNQEYSTISTSTVINEQALEYTTNYIQNPKQKNITATNGHILNIKEDDKIKITKDIQKNFSFQQNPLLNTHFTMSHGKNHNLLTSQADWKDQIEVLKYTNKFEPAHYKTKINNSNKYYIPNIKKLKINITHDKIYTNMIKTPISVSRITIDEDLQKLSNVTDIRDSNLYKLSTSEKQYQQVQRTFKHKSTSNLRKTTLPHSQSNSKKQISIVKKSEGRLFKPTSVKVFSNNFIKTHKITDTPEILHPEIHPFITDQTPQNVEIPLNPKKVKKLVSGIPVTNEYKYFKETTQRDLSIEGTSTIPPAIEQVSGQIISSHHILNPASEHYINKVIDSTNIKISTIPKSNIIQEKKYSNSHNTDPFILPTEIFPNDKRPVHFITKIFRTGKINKNPSIEVDKVTNTPLISNNIQNMVDTTRFNEINTERVQYVANMPIKVITELPDGSILNSSLNYKVSSFPLRSQYQQSQTTTSSNDITYNIPPVSKKYIESIEITKKDKITGSSSPITLFAKEYMKGKSPDTHSTSRYFELPMKDSIPIQSDHNQRPSFIVDLDLSPKLEEMFGIDDSENLGRPDKDKAVLRASKTGQSSVPFKPIKSPDLKVPYKATKVSTIILPSYSKNTFLKYTSKERYVNDASTKSSVDINYDFTTKPSFYPSFILRQKSYYINDKNIMTSNESNIEINTNTKVITNSKSNKSTNEDTTNEDSNNNYITPIKPKNKLLFNNSYINFNENSTKPPNTSEINTPTQIYGHNIDIRNQTENNANVERVDHLIDSTVKYRINNYINKNSVRHSTETSTTVESGGMKTIKYNTFNPISDEEVSLENHRKTEKEWIFNQINSWSHMPNIKNTTTCELIYKLSNQIAKTVPVLIQLLKASNCTLVEELRRLNITESQIMKPKVTIAPSSTPKLTSSIITSTTIPTLRTTEMLKKPLKHLAKTKLFPVKIQQNLRRFNFINKNIIESTPRITTAAQTYLTEKKHEFSRHPITVNPHTFRPHRKPLKIHRKLIPAKPLLSQPYVPRLSPKQVTPRQRNILLRPKFQGTDPKDFKVKRYSPKPLIRDVGFFREDFQHHKPSLSWRDRMKFLQGILHKKIPRTSTEDTESVLDVPHVQLAGGIKSKFLRDRINSIRSYVYSADFSKTTARTLSKTYFFSPEFSDLSKEEQIIGPLEAVYLRRNNQDKRDTPMTAVPTTTNNPGKSRRTPRTIFFLSPTVPYNRYF